MMGQWLEKCGILDKIEDHGECLESKRFRWSGHLKRMKGS